MGLCLFLQLVLKNFTSNARTSAETSARAWVLISLWKRPWHKNKWIEASTSGSRPNFSFFLHLCLLQHFLLKMEHEAEDQRMLLSCIFYHSLALRQTEVWRKCFFMMVPFSLDTRSLCLFLRLFIIPALIGVLRPHQTVIGVNFSCSS